MQTFCHLNSVCFSLAYTVYDVCASNIRVIPLHFILSNPNGIYLDQTALLEKVDQHEVILRHWHEVTSALLLSEVWVSVPKRWSIPVGEMHIWRQRLSCLVTTAPFTWQGPMTQPFSKRVKGWDHMMWHAMKEFSRPLCVKSGWTPG